MILSGRVLPSIDAFDVNDEANVEVLSCVITRRPLKEQLLLPQAAVVNRSSSSTSNGSAAIDSSNSMSGGSSSSNSSSFPDPLEYLAALPKTFLPLDTGVAELPASSPALPLKHDLEVQPNMRQRQQEQPLRQQQQPDQSRELKEEQEQDGPVQAATGDELLQLQAKLVLLQNARRELAGVREQKTAMEEKRLRVQQVCVL
jgi:hypothetical protein